jgi:peroxiredoxin
MATLGEQLLAFYESLMDRVGPANAAILRANLEERRAAGLESAALRVGDTAPDFTLPDQNGTPHRLSTRLAAGPVMLLFYRGGWSPLCELTLRAWQDAVPALRAAGASLLAVSPEDRLTAQETAASNWISFPLLCDTGHEVAGAYGLDYQMTREVAKLYARFNERVGKRCCAWRLPITATYVIAPDGVIRAAHVDLRPFLRMDPRDALAALEPQPQLVPG